MISTLVLAVAHIGKKLPRILITEVVVNNPRGKTWKQITDKLTLMKRTDAASDSNVHEKMGNILAAMKSWLVESKGYTSKVCGGSQVEDVAPPFSTDARSSQDSTMALTNGGVGDSLNTRLDVL